MKYIYNLIMKEINVQQERTPYQEFLDQACTCDGTLLRLPKKTSLLGHELFLSVRYSTDMLFPQLDEFFLNVDVFALINGEYIPVGMRDFQVKGNRASGNKNMHQRLPAIHGAHVASDKRWGEAGFAVSEEDLMKTAEKVGDVSTIFSQLRSEQIISSQFDYGKKTYQEMGIGSLMTAVALKVLKMKNIEHIEFDSLSSRADSLWSKFGKQPDQAELDVSSATNQNYTNTAIEKFV